MEDYLPVFHDYWAFSQYSGSILIPSLPIVDEVDDIWKDPCNVGIGGGLMDEPGRQDGYFGGVGGLKNELEGTSSASRAATK